MDEFELYVALWRCAQRRGAVVRYEDDRSGGGVNGYFDPNRCDTPAEPEIVIVRPWCIAPMTEPRRESDAPPPWAQPNITDELITLAHELGHFRSFLDGPERWLQYDDVSGRLQILQRENFFAAIERSLSTREANDATRRAILGAFDDDERALIIDEEMRAWANARETLIGLGYDNWPLFVRRESQGLHFHRWRLGLAEALDHAEPT